MADDDQLLELLGRALGPPPLSPPPERVAALRSLAREAPVRPTPARPAPAPTPPPGKVATIPRWERLGWVAAAASVAAAFAVVALLAAPSGAPWSGGSRSPAALARTRSAVALLRVALASGDPVAVAVADAKLLKSAERVSAREQESVLADAVAAHVDAIQFIRENPSPAALSAVPKPSPGAAASTGGAPGASAAGEGAAAPTILAGRRPPAPAPTTTVAAGAAPPRVSPSVTIGDVRPRLDGTFEVDFAVVGFTPASGGGRGTYTIRFSFDSGASPSVWAGPSPWTFPLVEAVTHHRVCAAVVSADGVEQPLSGNCRGILAG